MLQPKAETQQQSKLYISASLKALARKKAAKSLSKSANPRDAQSLSAAIRYCIQTAPESE